MHYFNIYVLIELCFLPKSNIPMKYTGIAKLVAGARITLSCGNRQKLTTKGQCKATIGRDGIGQKIFNECFKFNYTSCCNKQYHIYFLFAGALIKSL